LSVARRFDSLGVGLGVCSPERLQLAADPELAAFRRSC
jgi:hypothetical protein